MSRNDCPRAWEAHAIEDGRLGGAERASFERHAAGCASCARERAELADLRRELASLPTFEIGELDRRRLRAEVLRAANQRLVGGGSLRPRVAFAVAVAAAVPAIASAAYLMRTRAASQAAIAATAAPDSTAPRAHASAAEGATDPGEPAPEPEPEPESTPVESLPPAPASRAPRAPSAAASPGSAFAEAMAAFDAGAWGRADLLFARFVERFGADARAEDATFLRAVARARAGDRAGAAAMARAYLARYPRGFRRPEAERLAGE